VKKNGFKPLLFKCNLYRYITRDTVGRAVDIAAPGETVQGGGLEDKNSSFKLTKSQSGGDDGGGGGRAGAGGAGAVEPCGRVVCRALVNPRGGEPVAYLAACRVNTHAGFNDDELSFFESVARSLAGLIIVPTKEAA
jgi:hypothetical protein